VRVVVEDGAFYGLGLQHGVVELVEWDSRWARGFGQLAGALTDALGRLVVASEHVGSTAVEGLCAKPILDVAIRFAADADESAAVRALQSAGFAYHGDQGAEGGLLFVVYDARPWPIAHLHLLRYADPQWDDYIAVRDRLRSDASARQRYAAIKESLAAQFPADRIQYTAGKADLIAEILQMPRSQPPPG
jgi:GrpB-like predicted nucleotidyltransferase (UPF0157 family)